MAKFRSSFCFSHAYQGLGPAFKVIRNLSGACVLQRMMPREMQVVLDANRELGQDIAVELIAAGINDPEAIQLLG